MRGGGFALYPDRGAICTPVCSRRSWWWADASTVVAPGRLHGGTGRPAIHTARSAASVTIERVDPSLFAAFAVAYVALLAWGIALAVRDRGWTPANLPLLVIAGLVYDNAVLATGSLLGEGALLEGLNLARSWIHALITPLLVVFAWHAIARAGAAWANTRRAAVLAIAAALALMALELTHVVGLELVAEREHGVLSYTAAEPAAGPPLMVLLVAAALLVAGFLVWRRQRWPWLLIGTALMAIGSAVPIPIESGAVTNAVELILLVSILATKHFQDRADAAAGAER